ncbi:MAG TPA: Uma2 family endonuclease [Thermoanaerobaculia bacterium]|nr:Uma2 family endonuclease [Thermoanaerobaculia bacterium]
MAEPARRAPAPGDSELSSDDPYRYGWGLRPVRLPDGRVEMRETPLTPKDILDPQVGDHLTQSLWHGMYVGPLFTLILDYFKLFPDVVVGMDFKILWGIPGLSEPSPDIVVIRGVRDKEAYRRSFAVREEGARPCLVVEVVSDDPVVRSLDHNEKVDIYESAGVQEYLILDPPPVTRDGRFQMTRYRLDARGRYQLAKPDHGGFLSKTTGLWFGITPDGQELYLVDAATGERLEMLSEAKARAAYEAERRRAAEARADYEAQTRRQLEAENTRLREELERLKRTGD